MQRVDALKKNLLDRNLVGLAVDIDETLSWTVGFWVEKMQQLFGNPENLSPKEVIAKYRYTQNVPYWQIEEAQQWMEEHRNSNEIQELLPLIEGADLAIQEINRYLPIVTYITTRPESVIDGTKNWLAKHAFPSVDVIARPQEVHISEGNSWKAKVLEQLYPQVVGIIDDNPGLVTSLSKKYRGTVYLYDNTQQVRTDLNVIPCKNWREVTSKIKDSYSGLVPPLRPRP